jgi:hypothetical protein
MGGGVPAEFWSFAGSAPTNPENEPFLTWIYLVANTSDADVPYVFSTSYGEPEDTVSMAYMNRIEAEFQKTGARGITLFFATGDSGVTPDAGSCTGGRFAGQWPAGSPWVTGVGGTESGLVGGEKAWGGSAGGFSDRYAEAGPTVETVVGGGWLPNDSCLSPSFFSQVGSPVVPSRRCLQVPEFWCPSSGRVALQFDIPGVSRRLGAGNQLSGEPSFPPLSSLCMAAAAPRCSTSVVHPPLQLTMVRPSVRSSTVDSPSRWRGPRAHRRRLVVFFPYSTTSVSTPARRRLAGSTRFSTRTPTCSTTLPRCVHWFSFGPGVCSDMRHAPLSCLMLHASHGQHRLSGSICHFSLSALPKLPLTCLPLWPLRDRTRRDLDAARWDSRPQRAGIQSPVLA